MTRDLIEPEGPDESGATSSPLWKKLAWFVGLMLAGAVVVLVTAYVLRALLFL